MKHSRRLLLSRATFSAFLLTTLSIQSAKSAPTGAHVVSGSASIQQNGNVTTIKASNGSVINYNTFNVGPGQVVDFVQPSSSSRVMNRVTGSDPSRIFGMLEANGIVYLINPNGIYFQNGAMLNVGQLYAAGGHLSDQDFLNGKNRFTNMTGTVSNAGTMVASDSVHLLGEHVANFGSITAKTGAVVLASGSDILVGQRDGNIFVRANPSPSSGAAGSTAASTAPGVQNTGTIKAPRAIMGAGDMYSVAISNSGLIQSKHITVSGGQSGAVNVSGTLDASNQAANAKGGSITVTGQTVALQGATLNASGGAGGGTIQVGGGFHGQGPTPTSTQTTVDAATTIKADALSSGAGGKVVVWSNQATSYAGSISAQGAGTGNGGSAEVSSKGTLSYTGTSNLRGQNGTLGSLLLDPDFITITNSGTANTTLTSGQTLAFGDSPTNSTITTANLAAALNGANVTLEANDDITFHDSLSAGSNASPGNLTLRAGRSIIFGDSAAVTISVNGSLTATAADSGATGTLPGTPAITMFAGSVIDTSAAGKNITLINNGGGMQLASLTTGTSTGTIALTATGAVSQTGSLTAPNLSLTGTGSGSFNLSNPGNSVSSLSANVTGSLSYTNSTALNITGITGTSGAVSLNAPTLNINGAIQAGTGNLTLTASTAVTQAAAISGSGLELEGAGTFKLTNANNSFTIIASGATGDVNYVNKNALTVGSVNVNGINTTADVSLSATNITIAQAIQAGNLELTASGTVSENANMTIGGSGLLLEGGGTFNLNNANGFTTIASGATGPVSYVNSGALTVGSVTVGNATVGSTTANGINTTGNVRLSATNISIAQAIQVGNLTLTASGTVSESSGITIGGAGLELEGTGTFNLTNANGFTTFASGATGNVSYVNNGALTVGTVNFNGIKSGGANVSLQATDLTIASPIQTGTGNLTLTVSSSVIQNAAGTISGAGLELEGAGKFNLTNPANDFTTIASRATGSVSYVNNGALTVGSVDVDGIVTNGNVSLQATDIIIAKAIQTGTGNLLLDASGTVSENTGITISGNGLALQGAGTYNLTNANDFTTIASVATGLVSYVNAAPLTVGSVVVTSDGGTMNGINTTGNVSLSATDLTIADGIKVGNLLLNASGTVSENAGIIISGTGLALEGAGTFNLTNANTMTTFASVATGPVNYVNSGSLTVGSVTVGATTANGIDTTGDVSLSATNLTVANSIQVGNLALTASGTVSENNGITIGGGGLVLEGAGTFNLTNANDFSTLASGATGPVNYVNNAALSVGSVTVEGTTTNGIDTTGNVSLSATDLTIAKAIQVGNLTLTASGTVNENSGITIGGTGLELEGAGTFNLTNANTFNTIASGATGSVNYVNNGALTVGQVNVTGITSNGGDVSLQATSISIANPIDVGSGNLVLNSSSSVTQTALIKGGGLQLSGAGTVTLNDADNAFKTIASDATGAVSYTNSRGLTVGAVNVTGIDSRGAGGTGGADVTLSAPTLDIADSIHVGTGNLVLDVSGTTQQESDISGTGLELVGGQFTLSDSANAFSTIAANTTGTVNYGNTGDLTVGVVNFTGITSGNGDVLLNTTGNLTVAQSINAGTGNVLLGAGGTVTETTGAVTATGLAVVSGNTPTLTLSNAITNLAAQVTNSGQAFDFTSNKSFTVNTVAGVVGITTSDGDVNLQANVGDLNVDAAISAGKGAVQLTSISGAVNESGGGVTANTLLVQAVNTSMLTAANDVGRVAATISGNGSAFGFSNTTDLIVGIASGVNGITTNGGDVDLSSGGSLTLNQQVNAAGANVRLISNGNMTQAGAGIITANTLGVRNLSTTGGDITLTLGNSFTNVGGFNAFSGGALLLVDANVAGATIGRASPFADGNFNFIETSGLTGTGAANVGLSSAGAISIIQPINDLGGTVYLDSTGGITQTATIAAGTLGVRNESPTAGSITLTLAGNQIGAIAAADLDAASNGLAIYSSFAGTTTVTSLAAFINGGFSFAKTDGVSTAGNENILLGSGGILNLDAPVNAGQGTVRLVASTGIGQNSAGVITGSGLGASNTGASGDIDLTAAANQIGTGVTAGLVAASNAAPDGAIKISDANAAGMLISSITAASSGALSFAATAGVTTTNGATNSNDITLTALGGLTLQQNVTAPNADVLLQGSLVAETTGLVQANGLAVVSTFSPLLANNNAVNVIAANVKGAGQSFTYLNLAPVTVGDVLGVSGITTVNGAVIVDTLAGDLTLQSNVSAGTADVQLISAGSVTESGGAVKAGSLLVSAQGASVLGGANAVSTLAAEITGAGDFTFANLGNLTIGTVDGISGISTIGGSAINVQSGGSLSITQALNAGFGVGTIRLGSNGNLSQSGSGLITANTLVLRNDSTTSGNIVLTLGVPGNPLASNRFNALAASNAFSGGSILVLNGGTLGLAIVSDAGLTTGTNFNFGATNGLSATGNATVAVQTPAALSVAAPINVPNGTVYLDASGDITQSATITAAAAEFRNESALGGAITLNQANDIGTLAAFNNFGGAGIIVSDTGSSNLTIGSLGAVVNGGLSISGASGVATTGSQDIGLASGGSLTITQAVNAGFGTVRLVSNGDMTQSGSGLITALALGVQNQSAASGDILLTLPNIVPIVAASNAASGGNVVIVSGDSLGLSVSSVSGLTNGSFNFTATNGVTASGNALVALQSAAGITLNDPISNAGGTVLLEAHNAVSQGAGGTISAATLGVRDDGIFGDIVLTQNNSVGSFSGFNAVNGGQIIFYQGSAGPLSIDSTSAPSLGGAFNYVATTGVSTTGGGDIGLQSAGGLTLNQTVDAGSGTVRLVSNGDITQASTGIIAAGALGVENTSATGGGIVLGAANQVGTLAALNDTPGGALTVNNAANLTVGSVSGLASGNFNFSALSGVATTSGGGSPGTNVVQLSTSGNLTLTQDVSAPSSNVFLTTGGTVDQTGGAITADGLGIVAVNSPTLNGAANNVNVIAATITGPGQAFSYQNLGSLTVGTVGAIVGVTTNNGAVTLGSANGDLTLTSNIAAGTANVLLETPQGAVVESGGAVDAGGLAVIALNTPILTGPNSVGTIAAQVTGANQGFSFTQSGGFAVGSVLGVNGITTNDGPITLTAQTGSITLQKNVNAGSSNVVLTAQAGRLVESGGGVDASSLQATAVNGIAFMGPNAVAQLQAINTGSGGITFSNSAPVLKVTGLMSIGTGNILLQTNGNLNVNGAVSTGSGSIGLTSGGLETINAAVTAGPSGSVTLLTSGSGSDIVVNANLSATGGDVSATAGRNVILNNGNLTAGSAVHLNAVSGEIHEAGSGSINASSLFTSSNSGTDLENTNTVNVFNGTDNSGGINFVGSTGLLDVTGIAEGSGNVVIKNVGGLTVSGPLNSGNGIDLAVTGGRSNVLVDAQVNAGGLFQVTTPANVYLAVNDKAAGISISGETIEAAGNLVAAAGDLTLNASDVLYLEGTTYSGTNVLLNTALPQPRALAPQATIIVTDPTTVTINAGNSFAVGYLENLMAFGSLTINAKTATVGDTAARGALDIFANDITLMDRQPDGFSFDGRHDQGLSFVANSIDFGGASLSFSGQGNHQAFFSVNTGLPNVDRINGTTFYVDAEEDNQFQQATGAPGGHFTEGGTVSLASLPLQPIAGGVIDAEVVAVLAGSLPSIKFSDPTPEIRLSAAAVKKFTGLGVNSRDPDEEEKKGIKAKKALFKQLFKSLNPADSEYQVVVNRIAAGQVYKVLDTYNRIVGENLELVPKIKDVLSTQYSKYVGNGDIINAAGFDDYLVANQKKDAQARDAIAILGQVRELFGELGRIGLTTKELEICEDVIWRSLDIDDFTETDFLTFVGTPHRNFAPPTPPAPAPAPAAPATPAPAPAPGPTTAALSDRQERL